MATEEPWANDEPDDLSPGLTAPVRTIRDAIPTSRHARMLFDMAVDFLGERAVVEAAGGGTRYALFCRETRGSPAVVPWPLLQLGVKGRLSTIIPLIGSGEPPQRSGSPPRLRNLGPGEVVIHDGPHSVTITYGDDGRWIETSRSEDQKALADVVPALARGNARPVELLAEWVASLDLARHGPGRVLCPEPLPSVESAWSCGLAAIRDALFDGRIPAKARCAVADGYTGAALAWAATRDGALSAWRAQVRDAPPSRPGAAAPAPPRTKPPAEGLIELRGPSLDGAWPEESPAVVIPLNAVPPPPSSWGSFVRLLGGFGGTSLALLNREPGGFTLVGDGVVDLVDPREIDRMVDGLGPVEHPLLEEARAAYHGGRPPRHDYELIICRVVDERTLLPVVPSCVEARRSNAFPGRVLDGDRLRLRVVRQRRLP